METDQLEMMIKMALAVRRRAYAPYSKFHVGACVEANDGSLYAGCNIENSSFSPTICAERTAIFKAVSEGKINFLKIAVVGADSENETPVNYCPPCGVCRQVMREFCGNDFEIIIAKSCDDYKVKKLSELLPESFDKREV